MDLPGTGAVKLDDCLAFGLSGVFHASGPVAKRASRTFLCADAIERFSRREVKRVRNHCDTLGFRMGVCVGTW